jgi:hypothetical protein
MSKPHRSPLDEVDQLLLNARLRDELEPFIDESVSRIDVRRMKLSEENEFLASMLAWERAPVIPISRWFAPELMLPRPEQLNDESLHRVLWETLQSLYDQRIILECTDHLSDRQLYTVIYRDILPAWEKKVDLPRNYLHWRCMDDDDDMTWLRFYASPVERRRWQEQTGEDLPPCELPPFPRQMPTRSL